MNNQSTKKRTIIVLAFSLILFVFIVFLFWYQDLRYFFPTPKPSDLVLKPVGAMLISSVSAIPQSDKPVFLHFFNPECPCSKFNLAHVRELVGKYGDQVNFIAVLQSPDSVTAINSYKQTHLNIPYLLDIQGEIADSCGVYSTPQAVILTAEYKLFYRGNYNTSRYCTNQKTQFAKIAIDSLLHNHRPPHFVNLTPAYGCQLPSDIPATHDVFSLFSR
jgi:hypothetical protein